MGDNLAYRGEEVYCSPLPEDHSLSHKVPFSYLSSLSITYSDSIPTVLLSNFLVFNKISFWLVLYYKWCSLLPVLPT